MIQLLNAKVQNFFITRNIFLVCRGKYFIMAHLPMRFQPLAAFRLVVNGPTMAIDKGMPIEQVQKLLGHVRIDTTLHYAMVCQVNVKMAHRKFLN